MMRRSLRLAVAAATIVSGCQPHDANAPVVPIQAGGSGGTPSAPPAHLVVTGADSILVPGGTFEVRGHGLAHASAAIHQKSLTVLYSADTLLQLQVPATIVPTCAAQRTDLDVVIWANADTSIVHAHALPVPFHASLAVATEQEESYAVSRSCDVTLDSAGSYVAVVFGVDPANQVTRTQTVHLEWNDSVTVAPASVPLDLRRGADALRSATPPTLPFDVVAAGRAVSLAAAPRGSATSTCRMPVPGDSVPFQVARDSLGAINVTGLDPSAKTDTEYWHLVEVSKNLAVLVDSTALREYAPYPVWRSQLHGLLAYYDSVAAPVLERSFPPMPDRDGNGKVLVLMTPAPFGAAGLAFPTVTNRTDCSPAGEMIMLWVSVAAPWGTTLDDVQGLVRRIAHENTHVIDLGTRVTGQTSWIAEGIAVTSEFLVWRHDRPQPFEEDLAELSMGNGCFAMDHTEPVFEGGFGPYSAGCFRMTYLLEQAMHAGAGSLRDLTTRLANETVPIWTLSDVWKLFGGPARTSAQLTAEWYGSWYADERVATVDPMLDNRTWNIPALTQLVVRNSGGTWSAPMPDVRLTSPGSVVLSVGEPGARFVELDGVQAGARVRLPGVSTDGTIGLALLRIR